MPLLYVIFVYLAVLTSIKGEEGGEAAPSTSISLATSEECAEDVKQLHCNVARTTDFDVIQCLQADNSTLNSVSEKCQHAMWKRKLELTTKRAFDHLIPKGCASAFAGISECLQEQGTTYYVPCLVMHKDKIKNKVCHSFLNTVAALIFSDFRLLHKFITSCNSDIERYQCGRIDVGPASPKEELRHLAIETQGKTLHCLQVRVEKLDAQCRKQILRIGELQSDDYHLDRPLFYACHEDRERLCSSVKSGEGRIYSCLWQHKTAPEMSAACQQILTERQQLRSVDYRIGFRFAEACKSDIVKWSCSPSNAGVDDISLSHVMLCLEAVEKPKVEAEEQGGGVDLLSQKHSSDRRLQPKCRAELFQIRKEMLEDYRLSPDIIVHCGSIIEKSCHNAKEDPSSVLHCLIDLMRHTSLSVERPSESCVTAVQAVIKVTDVESNVRLDPIIERACHSLLTTKCSDQHETDGGVFECLLNNEHDPITTPTCRRHIHELYYFVSRDVTLDEPFLDSCAVDAHRYCGLQEKYWLKVSGDSASHPHLLSCLYNHRIPRKLENGSTLPSISGRCKAQVHRLMVARASSVSLDPEVFEVCLADLAIHCQDENEDQEEEEEQELEGRHLKPEKKKSGLACLQDNFNKLRPNCIAAVVTASANAVEDPNLDKFISIACESAEHELCFGYDDPKRTFQCLVEFKNDPKMPKACRLAVEHLQRTALKNIHISAAFLSGCRGDLEKYCKTAMLISKSALITCLSSRMTVQAVMQELEERQQVAKGTAHHGLSDTCRQQMSLELLQRTESIELDPELQEVCQQDAQRHCSHVKAGAGRVISCLRHNRNHLSTACHAKLFQREEVMAAAHQVDYPLFTACRQMISVYCAPVAAKAMQGGASLESGADDLVECLADAMQRFENRHHFDPLCRRELVSTLSLRAADYRLDLPLQKACHHDITKYCREDAARANASQYEDNGGVLHCLKKHFVATSPDQTLTHRCYSRLRVIITMEHVFYRLNPVLVKACRSDILQQCRTHLMNITKHIEPYRLAAIGDDSDELEDEDDDDALESSVQECLRDALQHNRLKSTQCIQEMSLVVREEITDIQLDPHLAEACTVEVRTHCGQVTPGHGQLMDCLLRILDRSDASSVLGQNCYRQLLARRELWQHVANLKDPESLVEMVHQINSGRLRNAFLLVVFVVLSLFFLIGICCGRATKRIPLELKTR